VYVRLVPYVTDVTLTGMRSLRYALGHLPKTPSQRSFEKTPTSVHQRELLSLLTLPRPPQIATTGLDFVVRHNVEGGIEMQFMGPADHGQ
jgi:hypothetical protein